MADFEEAAVSAFKHIFGEAVSVQGCCLLVPFYSSSQKRKLFYWQLTSGYRSCTCPVQGSLAFHSETVFYPCTRTRVTGCLSFNLACHLSRRCCDLRSSVDWSTSAPTTKSPSSPVHPPPGTGVTCPVCNRRGASDFGLRSHMRVHNRT